MTSEWPELIAYPAEDGATVSIYIQRKHLQLNLLWQEIVELK